MIVYLPYKWPARLIRSKWAHTTFWALMLLVHLPALFAGWRAVFGGAIVELELAGFVALNLAALFFVLKWRRVRWLEFARGPRAVLTLTLAVGLMHAGVVSESQPPALYESQQVIASVLIATSLIKPGRIVHWIVRAVRGGHDDTRCVGRCWLNTPSLATQYAVHTLAPRAPPFA